MRFLCGFGDILSASDLLDTLDLDLPDMVANLPHLQCGCLSTTAGQAQQFECVDTPCAALWYTCWLFSWVTSTSTIPS